MNLSSRIFLGTAEYGFFLTEIFVRLYLLKYYTDTIQLEPYLASIAIAIGIFWDAISDPIMGYISDHYSIEIKSKFFSAKKKRVFYMLLGSFFLGIFLSLLFSPIVINQPDIIKFLYLVVCYFLLNTFLTITSVPHSALCGEATTDPKIRLSIFGFRLFWGNLGLMSGIIIPTLFDPNKEIYKNILLFFLIFLSSIISIFAGFKYDGNHQYNQKNQTLKDHLKDLFWNFRKLIDNRYLLVLIISYIVAYIAIGINSAIALYYYEYFLKLSSQDIAIILFLFLVIWTLAIPLWIFLSKKIGKKNAVVLAVLLLGTGTIFSYPNFPEKNIYYPLGASVIGGILVAAIVILDTLIADLADYDYVKSKLKFKREGLFFGFLKFSIKLSRGISIILSGFLLSFIGFSANSLINEDIAKNISYIFGYVVGIFFVISGIIFYFFEYSEIKHNKVLKIINKYQ